MTDIDGDGVDDVAFANDALDGSSIATNKSLRSATTGSTGSTRTSPTVPTGTTSPRPTVSTADPPPTIPRPAETSGLSVATSTVVTSLGDRTAPSLGVLAPPRRVPFDAGVIVLRATCDEACTVSATGRLSIPSAAAARAGRRAAAKRIATVPLPRASARASRGRPAALRIAIPRRALPPLRRALATRAVPVAIIRIVARDATGNASPARVLSIPLVAAPGSRRR